MAGTLTISTLSDGTNSTSSTNCIKGSAKAWVNFVGSTGSINASYNVSSLTRTTTGTYTLAFTTAMSDANYCIYGSGKFDTAGGGGVPAVGFQRIATPATTSTLYFQVCNPSNAALFDAAVADLVVIGN